MIIKLFKKIQFNLLPVQIYKDNIRKFSSMNQNIVGPSSEIQKKVEALEQNQPFFVNYFFNIKRIVYFFLIQI